MKTISKFDFTSFEPVSGTGAERIIGGFSGSFSIIANTNLSAGSDTNNCLGGNCTTACGWNQNIHCNVANGCG